MTTITKARATVPDDELLPLAKAAKLLPHRPHPSALWRWACEGVRVGDERIMLPVLRFGRRLLVRRRDLFEFGERAGIAHTESRRPGT